MPRKMDVCGSSSADSCALSDLEINGLDVDHRRQLSVEGVQSLKARFASPFMITCEMTNTEQNRQGSGLGPSVSLIPEIEAIVI